MKQIPKHAFPLYGHSTSEYQPGITKRELFAAMAMLGMISDKSDCIDKGDLVLYMPKPLSIAAVAYADALIAELDKEPSK